MHRIDSADAQRAFAVPHAGFAHAAVVADNYNLCMVAHGYAKAPQ
jgi:hypothetical protein